MKYLPLLIIGMLLSCNKEKIGKDVIDTAIDLYVEDVNGSNLLSETTTGGIAFNAIKLFYGVNGEPVAVYNPNMDCPRSVCFLDDSGKEGVRVFPNDAKSDAYPVTYIQWNESDTDTIQCHFIRKNGGSYLVCDTVWINGSLMTSDSAVGYCRSFRLIK